MENLCFLSQIPENSETLNLYTDASNIGCVGYLGSKWFVQAWPENWKLFHMNKKHMFPITLAVELWGHHLTTEQLCFIVITLP